MSIHWILMNGQSGCLPDRCESFETSDAAIEDAEWFFDDSVGSKTLEEMSKSLKDDGIFYFDNPGEVGADYVSLESCDCNSPEIHNDN